MIRRIVLLFWALCAWASPAVRAQEARASRLVADTLHSKAIANNKYGDSPDRGLLVYLPPSYDSSSVKRYPTVYLLHGFGGTERSWVRGYRGFSIQPSMDSLVAAGAVREMIVVMPNAFTKLTGSFYANSESVGNWDDLIALELVAYIDGKYRTLARPESRGLGGHSMGGFGTFSVGMRHAGDVYSALYAMSGCCTRFSRRVSTESAKMWDGMARATSLEETAKLPFLPKVYLAMTAAFSPNPNHPPLFVDVPFDHKDSTWEPNSSAMARWAEHAPEEMVPRFADKLKRLRGFVFDVGTRDELVPLGGLVAMDSAFIRAGVPHKFETYDGDHTSAIGARMITNVLPFFSRTLDFSAPRR